MMTLWGCAFEDFLTRTFGAEYGNIVDVYLKRRGWNEKIQDKLYMKALRVEFRQVNRFVGAGLPSANA
ncbi:MAG: hypothetical protein JWN63_1169 [Candidatus Acidoferrum typicum]|nr:hypothetical protein [Candidatus Acidoferrum typicum]